MRRWLIRSATLDEEGVVLEYVEVRADLRANGLAHQHLLHIPRADEYQDGIQALEDVLEALMADALEDMAMMPAVNPEADIEAERAKVAAAAGAELDDDEPTLDFGTTSVEPAYSITKEEA